MRRRLLIALFAVGTVVGFGSGFAHLCHAHHAWHGCAHEKAPKQAPPAQR